MPDDLHHDRIDPATEECLFEFGDANYLLLQINPWPLQLLKNFTALLTWNAHRFWIVFSAQALTIFALTLTLLVWSACGIQECIAQQVEAKQGVVVESLVQGREASKAGLQVGDVILGWSRLDQAGKIESAFDLTEVEMEKAPLGPVTLEGLRGTEKHSWTMGPQTWGLKVRANFCGDVMSPYHDGEDLATPGKPLEAAARCSEAASQVGDAARAWLYPWFLARAAEMLAEKRQWKEATDAYQQAIQQTPEAMPAIRRQLFRALAKTYQQQSDWSEAEKYYQQSISESQRLEAGSLTVAADLDSLGTVSRLRGDVAKAEQYHQQALDIRQKLAPGSLAVVASLNNLGNVAKQRGDLAKAEEYHRQALDVAAKLAPESLEVAASLNGLGLVAWQRGDLAKAEKYYQQAYDIRQKLAPGSLDVASSLINFGLLARQRGDLSRAEEFYRQALDIRQKLVPESPDVALNFNNLGVVAWQRGDLAKAEQYYQQALNIWQKLAPVSLDAALSFNNLGIVEADRGDFAKAEEYYYQSLDIRQKLAPGSLAVAASFNNLGIVFKLRGDLEKADKYYHQSLEIEQRLAPESLVVATTYDNLGLIAWQEKDLAKAEEYQRRALEIEEKLAPGSLDVAESYANLGDLAQQRGDLVRAGGYYRQALAMEEKLAPESLSIAETMQGLGAVARKYGDSETAERYFRQALTIREKLAPGSIENAESLATIASILRDRRQMDSAEQLYAQALSALEKQSARLGGSEEIRSGFRADHSDIYRDYIDLLLTQDQRDQAFEVLERSRARTLLEMLANSHVDIRQGADAGLRQQEQDLQAAITAKWNMHLKLLSEKHTPDQLTSVEQEIRKLVSEYEEVEGRLRVSSPAYAALTRPQPLNLKQAQQLLDPETLLLEYVLAEKRSSLWVVSQNSSRVYELPGRREIEADARQLYQSINSRNRSRGAGQVIQRRESHSKIAAIRLSRMVLGPAVKELHRGKRLVIVSDGALAYVPFAALPVPDRSSQTLLAEHEIVELPSASTLNVLRRQFEGRKPVSMSVAVFADPVFDRNDDRLHLALKEEARADSVLSERATSSNPLERSARDSGVSQNGVFSRLPFSRREAEAIHSIADRDTAMEALDFNASKSNAMSAQLKDYRIIHFATHGLLDSENPELSGLVFSLVDRQGREQDGFLRLLDIYNLQLNADLVVMSACQTALGKQIEGEGVVGLTRGFMYAGVPRVISSLWNVNDEATAELMGKFYEGMLKNHQTPAAALRSAQMWMSRQRRWQDPYYWAGFVLQGDWR